MAIDFGDTVYTTPTGETIPFASFPPTTWINGLTRALNHVLKNEVVSKVVAKRKTDGTMDAETEAQIIADARAKYIESFLNGTWGEPSGRAPRGPAANREEQIFNNLLAEDVRKSIAKAGFGVGTDKDTWIVQGDSGNPVQVTLAQLMERYLGNAKYGEARRGELSRRAADKYAAERTDAEHRKAAKAREAAAGKAASLDDF